MLRHLRIDQTAWVQDGLEGQVISSLMAWFLHPTAWQPNLAANYKAFALIRGNIRRDIAASICYAILLALLIERLSDIVATRDAIHFLARSTDFDDRLH